MIRVIDLVLNDEQKARLVRELHDKSGLGIMKCKMALIAHNWDIDATVKTLLRERENEVVTEEYFDEVIKPIVEKTRAKLCRELQKLSGLDLIRCRFYLIRNSWDVQESYKDVMAQRK